MLKSPAAIAATVVLAFSMITTGHPIRLLSELGTPLLSEEQYADKRDEQSFNGLPILQLKSTLLSKLPRGASVGLRPGSLSTELENQRFAEGLYPLRLYPHPECHVTAKASDSPPSESALLLLQAKNGKRYFLDNCPQALGVSAESPSPRTEDRMRDRFRLRLPSLLLSVATVLGLGILIWQSLVRVSLPVTLLIPCLFLCGSLGLAVAYSVGTWLDLGIPPLPLRILGYAGLLGVGELVGRLLSGRESKWIDRASGPRSRAHTLAIIAFAILVAGHLYSSLNSPMIGWDGRSIWAFHGKMLWSENLISTEDRSNPVYASLSHLDYPLLLPAWIAWFSQDQGFYNERLAGVGVAILFVSIWLLLSQIATRKLGIWAGFVLATAAFGFTRDLSAWVYADGLLALLLLIAALCFLGERTSAHSPIGWLALAAASLLKNEGLFFSVILISAIGFFHWKANGKGRIGEREKRWMFHALIALAPAILHVIWARGQDFPTDFGSAGWVAAFEDFPYRVMRVLHTSAHAAWFAPHFKLGVLCFLGQIVLHLRTMRIRRHQNQTSPAEPRLYARVAAVMILFTLSFFLFTIWELESHIYSALSRLLLHPSLFLMAGLLLQIMDFARERDDLSSFKHRT